MWPGVCLTIVQLKETLGTVVKDLWLKVTRLLAALALVKIVW